MENKDNGRYKVFISEKPQILLHIPLEKRQLLRDHSVIFHGLAEKEYLSAKDIHELYWEPTEQKFGKSMKTVYRYLDLLEQAGLVKIAGYRKPENSPITEKLYCRTALLYFSKEPVKWWELPEYKTQFEKKTDFLVKFKDLKIEHKTELRELINSFTELRDKYINAQLKYIEQNPEMVDILSNLSIMEIKGIITDIAVFEMFINEIELVDRFRNLNINKL